MGVTDQGQSLSASVVAELTNRQCHSSSVYLLAMFQPPKPQNTDLLAVMIQGYVYYFLESFSPVNNSFLRHHILQSIKFKSPISRKVETSKMQ